MNRIGIVHQSLLLFALFGVLFVPFSFHNIHLQAEVTQFIFEDVILQIASYFTVLEVVNPEISSDSTTLYLLLFILFVAAIAISIILSFFKFRETHQHLVVRIIQMVLTYYLSLIMLKYGFDKIFGTQFYIPEPNTLYTPLGMLDRDIVFWSTMGTSYSYSIFMGAMEVVPALLLLFSRVRVLGLSILFGVLINIVFINFCFDISVKLYSSFLLVVCAVLLFPHFKSLMQFFVLKKPTVLSGFTGKNLIPSRIVRWILKATLIISLSYESLYPHFRNEQYSNGNESENSLYGAYEILKTEGDTINGGSFNLKRFFIHRANYFIFQYQDDTMEDYHLEINPNSRELILTNYEGQVITFQYEYSEISERLELKSLDLGITFYSKSLPWRDLPILRPLFHWTVDEI